MLPKCCDRFEHTKHGRSGLDAAKPGAAHKTSPQRRLKVNRKGCYTKTFESASLTKFGTEVRHLRKHDGLAAEGVLCKNSHQFRSGQPYARVDAPQAGNHLPRPARVRVSRECRRGRKDDETRRLSVSLISSRELVLGLFVKHRVLGMRNLNTCWRWNAFERHTVLMR